MTFPTYPDFDMARLGVMTTKDGKLATVWRATTTHDGQRYSLVGPLKGSVLLSTAGYVHDTDGARDILSKRLPEHIGAGRNG